MILFSLLTEGNERAGNRPFLAAIRHKAVARAELIV